MVFAFFVLERDAVREFDRNAVFIATRPFEFVKSECCRGELENVLGTTEVEILACEARAAWLIVPVFALSLVLASNPLPQENALPYLLHEKYLPVVSPAKVQPAYAFSGPD